ncbi:MAG: hypothetical protein GC193_07920 [Cryomorphaceae bacterium]|nr:hypothetical protein [Cryomorphaceae bacterium]
MSILLKTHKLLWGRSGNRCAFEECRNELIAEETETDDESIIGDEAHIIARKKDGPRGNHPMSAEDRDKYDNLILLCRNHHKQIDDQDTHYTIEKLIELKKVHEKWVKESLHLDIQVNKDDLTYASYIDELFKRLDLENYNGWTQSLISNGQPSIGYTRLKEIEKVPTYVVSRFWPGRYQELETAILNLKNVLNDLIKVFYKHVENDSLSESENPEFETIVFTRKFYQIDEWNPERYDELLEEFNYHAELVVDLTLELTRATNFVIEKTRKYLTPKYREEQGKLLVTAGPFMDMSWQTFKVEYKKEEKEHELPYPGLKEFMTERAKRDLVYGEGFNDNYFLDHHFGGNEES